MRRGSRVTDDARSLFDFVEALRKVLDLPPLVAEDRETIRVAYGCRFLEPLADGRVMPRFNTSNEPCDDPHMNAVYVEAERLWNEGRSRGLFRETPFRLLHRSWPHRRR